MKIPSIDRKSWIAVSYHSDGDGYTWYEAEVHVGNGRSQFGARNTDLQFLGINEFIWKLNAFVTNRKVEPELEGTYDSYIRLRGTAARVILEFRIGDAVVTTPPREFATSGSFEVDQEYLTTILREFEEMANADA